MFLNKLYTTRSVKEHKTWIINKNTGDGGKGGRDKSIHMHTLVVCEQRLA